MFHGCIYRHVGAQFFNGATSSSCATLSEPGFTAQSANTNPYFLTVSQTSYRPQDIIQGKTILL